jgi:hypothetical protein
MKKILFGLIATVMFSLNGNAQEINELNKDINFINFLNNEISFIQKEVKKEIISKIYNDKVLSKDELEKFYGVFGINQNDYLNFVKKQNALLIEISKKYEFVNFSDEKLKEILKIEIEEVFNSENNPFYKIDNDLKNCKRRFVNALTINSSVAIGGHYACVSLDLTGPAGLLCHGAVLLGHMAANDNAYLDYQDCLKK